MAMFIFVMVVLMSNVNVLMGQCAKDCFFHYSNHEDMKNEEEYSFAGESYF